MGEVGCESHKFTVRLNARYILFEIIYGMVSATHVLVEKKIRNLEALGRVSYNFIITMTARLILPEKTEGIWGESVQHTIWKMQREARMNHPWHINLQSRWRSGVFYMRKFNGFSGVGGEGQRGYILIRIRDRSRSRRSRSGSTSRSKSRRGGGRVGEGVGGGVGGEGRGIGGGIGEVGRLRGIGGGGGGIRIIILIKI